LHLLALVAGADHPYPHGKLQLRLVDEEDFKPKFHHMDEDEDG
jgi:hypothetical protein